MKKQWYFYDNEGKVNLIYMIEPSQEMLEEKNYIIADKIEDKEGFNTVLSVNLENKELKVEYIKKEMTLEEKVKMLDEQNKKLTTELVKTKQQSEQVNASLVNQMSALKISVMQSRLHK